MRQGKENLVSLQERVSAILIGFSSVDLLGELIKVIALVDRPAEKHLKVLIPLLKQVDFHF